MPFAKPVERTATGLAVPIMTLIWTGTKSDGQKAEEHCESWTSISSDEEGETGDTGTSNWTSAGPQACNKQAGLYCFEL